MYNANSREMYILHLALITFGAKMHNSDMKKSGNVETCLVYITHALLRTVNYFLQYCFLSEMPKQIWEIVMDIGLCHIGVSILI